MQTVGLAGAGWQPWVCELFIFADEVLDHAFVGRDGHHLVEVDLAQVLDVDRAAILWDWREYRWMRRVGLRYIPCRSCGSTVGSIRISGAFHGNRSSEAAHRRQTPSAMSRYL